MSVARIFQVFNIPLLPLVGSLDEPHEKCFQAIDISIIAIQSRVNTKGPRKSYWSVKSGANTHAIIKVLMIPKPKKRLKNPGERAWLTFRANYLQGKKTFEGYYICELCGLWIEYCEVDHIQKRSLRPDLVLDASNLRILCGPCHKKVT